MSAISQKTEKLDRIAEIEARTNSRLKDLLYQLHWGEDLMHREIAARIGVPRPTVTRWFSQLEVPSQPSERITKTHLTSWPYLTGQKKPKPRYVGPKRSSQEYRGNVNVRFFKRWTPEMAYVLGYFAADGCLAKNRRGSHYLQFVSTDIGLLRQIKQAMGASQAIRKKTRRKLNPAWRPCYHLQIGSFGMYQDLLKLGLTPRKASRLELPKIPRAYISDFARGFFDGDGSISYGLYPRSSRPRGFAKVLLSRFTSGSANFLTHLKAALESAAGLKGGGVMRGTRAFHLQYSISNSIRLFSFMYRDLGQGLFLRRKHRKFLLALKFIGKGP